MNKLLAILLFSQFAAAATLPTSFKTDVLEFGKPSTGDKTLYFKRGTATAQPGFKWNESGGKMQFSNDGSTYTDFLTSVTVDTSTAIVNAGLASSVASNALTVTINGKNGSTPSGANQILASFRNGSSTAGTATYSQVALSSALSIVVPSGATLGHASGVAEDVWVYLLLDGSTIDVCVAGSHYFSDSHPVGLTYPLTQISAGSTSKTTLYCASSHAGATDYAIRTYGRLSISEATAGTWATAATNTTLLPLLTTVSSITFTTAGSFTFTVPAGVHSVMASICGAGGGGGGGSNSGGGATLAPGGGGGAGTTLNTALLPVTPAEALGITIGAGGTGGAAAPTNGSGGAGTAGGDTQITRSSLAILGALGGLAGGGGTHNNPSGIGGGNPNAGAANTGTGAASVLYTAQIGYAGFSGANGGGSNGVGGAGFAGSGYYVSGFAVGTGGGSNVNRGGGGAGGNSQLASGGTGGAAATNTGGTNGTLCSGGGGAGSENVGKTGGDGYAAIYWVSP